MYGIPPDQSSGVIWREGSWRCELGLVLGYPVLRLYDGDKLELEHEIMPGTISATADVMRRAVCRHLSGEYGDREARTPRQDPKAMGPASGAWTLCPHCRSLRAYLGGGRPGEDWYVCEHCGRRWDGPSES